jgi:hypothetical protein
MIKTRVFCDKCGEEITDSDKSVEVRIIRVNRFEKAFEYNDYKRNSPKDLCSDCAKELEDWFEE